MSHLPADFHRRLERFVMPLAKRLRACADEVMEFPHPSACDHLHCAHHLMREAADYVERDEMSPDFTDTARAALLWVLWHHQGGSSPVGQPIRFALGMGAHEPLSERQVAEAKRWAAMTRSTTAEFHRREPAPNALVEIGFHAAWPGGVKR